MKIIAVDPGYDRVGIAILEKKWLVGQANTEQWLYSETFQTDRNDEINHRLYKVGQRISELCQEYKVEYLAIEKLFFTSNQKTAMQVSQARGIIIFAAQLNGTKVMEFTPLQIKSAVAGHGKEDKKSVIDMTCKLITIPNLQDGKKRLDDEYDAIACGLTFFAHYRPKLNKA